MGHQIIRGAQDWGFPQVANRRLRILIVEDNLDAAESFIMLLQLQGHDIRAAHTDPAALEVAAGFVPGVAFIDLGLPGLDGYEVARWLRAQPAFQPTVLVALSGSGQEEDKRRAQAAGFDHHLTTYQASGCQETQPSGRRGRGSRRK